MLLLSGCAAPLTLDAPVPRARPLPLPPAGQHLVMPGESVIGLAKRYGLRTDQIVALNGLDTPYTIYVGQVLKLAAPPPALRPRPTHTVRAGETMIAVSRAYGVGLGDLIALNRGYDPNLLKPGQTLRLPPVLAAASNPAPTPVRVVARPATAAPLAVAAVPVPRAHARDLAAARAAATRDPPPLSGGGFLWPVDGSIVGRFGEGPDGRRNDGVNLAATLGAPVRAAENGIVVFAGETVPAFGRMLLIRHAEGYLTAYAHNDTLLTRVGDVVERGQTIALAGNTGSVTAPQVHFELRKGTDALDPAEHLPAPGTRVAERG